MIDGDFIIWQKYPNEQFGNSNPTNDELVEMTQQVIDALEKYGWIRGALFNDQNNMCILGAANFSAGTMGLKGERVSSGAYRKCNNLITMWAGELASFLKTPVICFNDKPDNSFEQVISTLRDFMHELKGR